MKSEADEALVWCGKEKAALRLLFPGSAAGLLFESHQAISYSTQQGRPNLVRVNDTLRGRKRMARGYRSWAERREIIRAIIADTNPQPLAQYQLTESEEVYFRARSNRMIENLARKTSTFKSYYALPTARPFGYVVGITGVIMIAAALVGLYIYLAGKGAKDTYPLLAACATLGVGAIGWVIASGVTHRNTIRQNTNNIIFARFSQAPFGEALHRFHKEFGYDSNERISEAKLDALRARADDEEMKSATSAIYLLNYFEFIAAGVLHGDLNKEIVRNNFRGAIVYYYDKCEPYIKTCNRENPRTYEHLIRLRTHYREP